MNIFCHLQIFFFSEIYYYITSIVEILKYYAKNKTLLKYIFYF